MALGAHGSKSSMIAGGPRGAKFLQVPGGSMSGVGSTCGGKWNGYLTCCLWFPDSAFTAQPSLRNHPEVCCGDCRDTWPVP